MKYIAYNILLLILLIFNSFGEDNQNQFIQLYKGEHKTTGIQLLSSFNTNNLFLRISEKNIPYSIHQYISFKMEPYLSQDIIIACDTDTLHPILTNVEKTYEAGNEIIYMMIFDSAIYNKCADKRFIIHNFTGLEDTLTINLR